MGRSRGGLTSKIHAVVDANGLPVRLALTRGETHDNRLAGKLLSRLKSGSMLLADRGYDADWIRGLAMRRGARANIPPKRNQIRSTSVPISTVTATGSSASSTGSSNAVALQHATTSWLPTTLPSYSLPRSGYGFALMSPRPSLLPKRRYFPSIKTLSAPLRASALGRLSWQRLKRASAIRAPSGFSARSMIA